MAKALGANPTPIPAEIYTALQTGVVDAFGRLPTTSNPAGTTRLPASSRARTTSSPRYR
jgi:TRAP-type C4-dicarboxylate transport system substrate-binding protein